MRELDDLKELLTQELKKINKKGDLSPSELDNATKVMCLLEGIEKYKAKYEIEADPEGYSMGRVYRQPMYSGNGYSYDRGYSNANGRRSGASRRMGGYSGHGDHEAKIEMLEGILSEAQTEAERRTIMDFIDRLQ